MNTLTAEKRDLKTKAKKLRKEGYVIGNLFGRDIENSIPLKVDSREAAKFLKDNKKGCNFPADSCFLQNERIFDIMHRI